MKKSINTSDEALKNDIKKKLINGKMAVFIKLPYMVVVLVQ